jgi:small subunit ribosomal protein S7
MPDPVYDSRLIELIVRQIMRKGKKSLAYKIMYETMTQIAETTQQDPLVVIEQAIRNATPLVEVKARRVGRPDLTRHDAKIQRIARAVPRSGNTSKGT